MTALDNIDLRIDQGEFVLIKGPSGCGKSTLLFSLGGLLKPTSGAVRILNKDIYALSENQRLKFRSQEIGFVFQSYYLVPYLNVMENFMLLNKVNGARVTKDDMSRIAKRLHLEHRLDHKPSEMSVGEKQRASLARALALKPKLILADEPTGNLDPENAEEVLRYLEEFRKDGGTVVMVTHGSDADKYATRNIKVDSGNIID